MSKPPKNTFDCILVLKLLANPSDEGMKKGWGGENGEFIEHYTKLLNKFVVYFSMKHNTPNPNTVNSISLLYLRNKFICNFN